MKESRIPKMGKDYNPRGRRKVGRPKERWTVEYKQAAKSKTVTKKMMVMMMKQVDCKRIESSE